MTLSFNNAQPFNLLELTVRTAAIPYCIYVNTRGTQVYQLSMKSLYQLLYGIFASQYGLRLEGLLDPHIFQLYLCEF